MSRSLDDLVAGVTRAYTPPASLAEATREQLQDYEHLAEGRGVTPEQILAEYRAAHARQLVELDAADAASALVADIRRS
ncbi:hypothetical protein GRS96_12185 [Rathayibacter sp. VKM Ac-2803]|uniref:hypothetical protein n=1 Tax=Rathayibacter sp. VKM Ac-2803 TaxID=2609256 RepID=UPI0013584E45|nr:hypothetical protein [Rathayibacter sp. VKM Ac-2803]MWV50028.1 hypothetical protein [Rathayibacter sp. VKM Ac-2803]